MTSMFLTPALRRAVLPVLAASTLTAAAILAPFQGAHQANAGDAAKPDRVVAVGGAITEIVYALGEAGRLVGRDTTSSYPPAASELPDVGYIRALSPEGVLSLNPDLILMLEGAGPPEALSVLKGADVPLVTVPDRYTAEGVVDRIQSVGRAMGVEDKAAALIASVEADFETLEDMVEGSGPSKTVLFILSLNGGRILASGDGTAAAGVIELAGLQNAVSGFEGYKPLSNEALIQADPDVILIMDRSGDHAVTLEKLQAIPALSVTAAVRNGHVVSMDGLYLLGFGPRTAQAVSELATRVKAFSSDKPGKDT
ncbi:hemin ABC transporter substrate-binding protein [Roseibium aquae]|uniref:Hemin ABC transporter substrate-binding protein n=1 Tax=Roseibium aquae TaxID=1323746 RepID=A0A916X1X8_9HYPH|nr:ABC transporter substrate-binding protein [Roseibium aquae]GGB60267.1 hemin ABC transporter substrate-binding protein [Roseibium aquae]